VGIGGRYLGDREPRSFTRNEYVPVWPPAGKAAMVVIHERVLDVLHNHQPLPLPEVAAEKIDALLAKADEALA